MESEAATAAGEVWCGGAGSVSALTPGSSIPICYHSSFGPHDDLLLLEVQHVASRRSPPSSSSFPPPPSIPSPRSDAADPASRRSATLLGSVTASTAGWGGPDVLERSHVMSSMIDVSIMMNVLRRKMMWAADFDEDVVAELEENCLKQLVIQFQRDLSTEKITEISENGKRNFKNSHSHNGNESYRNVVRSTSGHPLFGLTRANFWSRNDQLQPCSTAATRNGDDELSVFIVAAILIINHQKIFREAHSMDDVINADI